MWLCDFSIDNFSLMALIALGVTALAGQAMAAPNCGMNTGQPATGEPIIIDGVQAEKLRKLGVKLLPLLAVGQQLQPVGAQAVRGRAILDACQQGLHFLGGCLLEPHAQAPIGNVRFKRVITQRLRVLLLVLYCKRHY